MAKIEGIRIRNFRCLKNISLGRTYKNPDAESLSPLTVVIGKNGVGKSTLFDAFGFLADALKYGVEEACDKRGGFEKIRSQNQSGNISFHINYKIDDSSIFFVYDIDIGLDSSNRPVVVNEVLFQKQPTKILLFLGGGLGFTIKNNETSKKTNDNELEIIFNVLSVLENSNWEEQIDSLPNALNAIYSEMGIENREIIALNSQRNLGIATLGALKQHPEISAFRQFLESWYLSYFSPDAARSLPLDGVHQHLNSRGDNLANVVKYMEREYGDKFQDILDSIAEKIPGIHKISTQKTPDGRLLLCFNDKGFQDPFYAPQMSDGTLKLFAYLLLLADPNPPPFICIEEPENGLYHKLLEVLASEFRRHTSEENKTQLFITTHQPYFVDGLNPREVWILEKGEDGFSTIRRASDDELVNNLFEEEMPLGGLWYSGYLDKRAKPCTLKS